MIKLIIIKQNAGGDEEEMSVNRPRRRRNVDIPPLQVCNIQVLKTKIGSITTIHCTSKQSEEAGQQEQVQLGQQESQSGQQEQVQLGQQEMVVRDTGENKDVDMAPLQSQVCNIQVLETKIASITPIHLSPKQSEESGQPEVQSGQPEVCLLLVLSSHVYIKLVLQLTNIFALNRMLELVLLIH